MGGARDPPRAPGKPLKTHVVGTGALVGSEVRKIEQTYRAHTSLRGMFAVDAGSTQGVAAVMRNHGLHAKGVRAGGFDLLPETLDAINRGLPDFTIDHPPYPPAF